MLRFLANVLALAQHRDVCDEVDTLQAMLKLEEQSSTTTADRRPPKPDSSSSEESSARVVIPERTVVTMGEPQYVQLTTALQETVERTSVSTTATPSSLMESFCVKSCPRVIVTTRSSQKGTGCFHEVLDCGGLQKSHKHKTCYMMQCSAFHHNLRPCRACCFTENSNLVVGESTAAPQSILYTTQRSTSFSLPVWTHIRCQFQTWSDRTCI